MKRKRNLRKGHYEICKCNVCNEKMECFIPKKYEKKFSSIEVNCFCGNTYELIFEIELYKEIKK